jgi:hypothetical protein
MSDHPPLLIFETSILLDYLFERDAVAPLVDLAERGKVELVIPQMALAEFRGTALRLANLLGTKKIEQIRSTASALSRTRTSAMAAAVDKIREGCADAAAELDTVKGKIDAVAERVSRVAKVVPHTAEAHLEGYLRYLAGHPPDRPRKGLKDCRIFEAVKAVALSDSPLTRPLRVFLTKDSDFDAVTPELLPLGVRLERQVGRLYGELIGGLPS